MRRQYLFNIGIALLILLYSYTAISKLLDQYRFVFQMKLSPFSLVRDFATAWGWIVPIAELAIVIMLCIVKAQKQALYFSLALLVVFEIYIVGMLMTGLKLPCACGGVIAFMSWKIHVLFNAIFITINIISISLFNKERFKISS